MYCEKIKKTENKLKIWNFFLVLNIQLILTRKIIINIYRLIILTDLELNKSFFNIFE